MRRSSWPRRIIALVAASAWMVGTDQAQANGGEVRVSQVPAGPYEVTVYTSPTPLVVGTADVSVLVERGGTGEIVNGARVIVAAAPLGGPLDTQFDATREQATNKLFYAAKVPFSTAGRWRLGVQVAAPAGTGDVAFEADVRDQSLLDAPFWLMFAGAVLAGTVCLAMLQRGRHRTIPARPAGRRRRHGRKRGAR